jgi:ankyrin repeat protein
MMDSTWEASVEADRNSDALVQDAKLLKDVRDSVHDLVKNDGGAKPKTMKYSAEWWRDWRQTTKPRKHRGDDGARSETKRRQARSLPSSKSTNQVVSTGSKSLRSVHIQNSARRQLPSATQQSEERPTVLSTDEMLFLSVEDLIQMKNTQEEEEEEEEYDDDVDQSPRFPSEAASPVNDNVIPPIASLRRRSVQGEQAGLSQRGAVTQAVTWGVDSRSPTLDGQPRVDPRAAAEGHRQEQAQKRIERDSHDRSPRGHASSSALETRAVAQGLKHDQQSQLSSEDIVPRRPSQNPRRQIQSASSKKIQQSEADKPRINHGVVFGVEKRVIDNAVKRSPGPIYRPSLKATRQTSVSTKFGGEQRAGMNVHKKQGTDAQYMLPTSVGLGRAATLGSGPPRPWHAAEKKESLMAQVVHEVAGEGNGEGGARRTLGGGGEKEDEEEDEVYPFQTFGFGCSMEEHVLYGQCLDGRCCERSHMEQVMKHRVQKKKVEPKGGGVLRRGAVLSNEELENDNKKAALHFACAAGGLETVHKLLLGGALTDVSDEDGNTPLALAAAGGHVRVVQRLIVNAQYPRVSKIGFVERRLTPSINVTDDDGRTPLHRAAEAGHHSIVKLLLEAGANAEVQDHENRTALDVCSSAQAFHLLRSRAEVYNRRERLAGVALKKNLLESAEAVVVRETTREQAAQLRNSVAALDKAADIMSERRARADADILHYKAAGELQYESTRLETDAAVGVDSLIELCLQREHATSRAIMNDLGLSKEITKKKPVKKVDNTKELSAAIVGL